MSAKKDETMDEATQRKLLAAGAYDRLTTEFITAGIDPFAFGFYD